MVAAVDLPPRLVALSLASCLSSGCAGPPAPDVVLCRDIINRLCLGPVCASTKSALDVQDEGCETELRTRTGCDAEEFGFTSPDRLRVLECRRLLLRVSPSTQVKAPCPDVDELFATCPDLTKFLNGVPP
jgi:hypothetical protein